MAKRARRSAPGAAQAKVKQPFVYLDRRGEVTFELPCSRILYADGTEHFVVVVDTVAPRTRSVEIPDLTASEAFVLELILEGDFDAADIAKARQERRPRGVSTLSPDHVRRCVARLRELVPIVQEPRAGYRIVDPPFRTKALKLIERRRGVS